MKLNKPDAVDEYQCCGCVLGGEPCYEKGANEECAKHVPGTMAFPGIGIFLLGMPTGFNRLGPAKEMKVKIFKTFSDGWGYNMFNIPVWKHLDKNGNTLVRGLSPRTNFPFLHVFLENCLDEIDCLEITNADIRDMD